MKQFLDEDDKPHAEARVNGYSWGDRLLEDVMFGAKIVNDRVHIFMPKGSPSETYMKDNRISISKWCKIIEEDANKGDIDSWEALDGSDLYLTEVEGATTAGGTGAREIQGFSGDQLMKILKAAPKK